MNCPNCGCKIFATTNPEGPGLQWIRHIPESEVELPMAGDPRYRDPEHWMTEAEAAAENASGPVQTWIDETTVRGYSGHSIIRVDPNDPSCIAYDEAMKDAMDPVRAKELAELRRLMEL